MSQIKTTDIEGDVAVGRHVVAGGNALVQGNATIKKNLKIEGWLDARNIKGPNKGLFTSVTQLEQAYPRPRSGYWALVGRELPADLYVVNDLGKWVATGSKAGEIVIDGGGAMFDVNSVVFFDEVDMEGALNVEDSLATATVNTEDNAPEGYIVVLVDRDSRFYAKYDGIFYRHFATSSLYGTVDGKGIAPAMDKIFVCRCGQIESHPRAWVARDMIGGNGHIFRQLKSLDAFAMNAINEISRSIPTPQTTRTATAADMKYIYSVEDPNSTMAVMTATHTFLKQKDGKLMFQKGLWAPNQEAVFYTRNNVPEASTSADGVMSKEMFNRLGSGGVMTETASSTAVTISYPNWAQGGSRTLTLGPATTARAGLMTVADKRKLNLLPTLPEGGALIYDYDDENTECSRVLAAGGCSAEQRNGGLIINLGGWQPEGGSPSVAQTIQLPNVTAISDGVMTPKMLSDLQTAVETLGTTTTDVDTLKKAVATLGKNTPVYVFDNIVYEADETSPEEVMSPGSEELVLFVSDDGYARARKATRDDVWFELPGAEDSTVDVMDDRLAYDAETSRLSLKSNALYLALGPSAVVGSPRFFAEVYVVDSENTEGSLVHICGLFDNERMASLQQQLKTNVLSDFGAVGAEEAGNKAATREFCSSVGAHIAIYAEDFGANYNNGGGYIFSSPYYPNKCWQMKIQGNELYWRNITNVRSQTPTASGWSSNLLQFGHSDTNTGDRTLQLKFGPSGKVICSVSGLATATALNSKVDKVQGKGLSTHDFSNEWLSRLGNTGLYGRTSGSKFAVNGIFSLTTASTSAQVKTALTSADGRTLTEEDLNYCADNGVMLFDEATNGYVTVNRATGGTMYNLLELSIRRIGEGAAQSYESPRLRYITLTSTLVTGADPANPAPEDFIFKVNRSGTEVRLATENDIQSLVNRITALENK